MPDKIYLIGTVHTDIDGPERLEKLLNQYKPDVIFTEGVREESREESKQSIDKQLDIDVNDIEELAEMFDEDGYEINPETTIKLIASVGYEIFISLNYGDKYNIPVIMKDKLAPVFEDKDIKAFLQKEKDIDFIIKHFNLDLTTEKYRERTEKVYRKGNKREKVPEAWTTDREKIWADEIKNQDGTVVLVAGASHSYKGSPLYDILADYEIESILLCDADKIE